MTQVALILSNQLSQDLKKLTVEVSSQSTYKKAVNYTTCNTSLSPPLCPCIVQKTKTVSSGAMMKSTGRPKTASPVCSLCLCVSPHVLSGHTRLP